PAQAAPGIVIDDSPELTPAHEPASEPPPDEMLTGESQPVELEQPQQREAPFHVSLVVERGPARGTTFVLASDVNSFGGQGAAVALGDDPHVAPHAATFLFEHPEAPLEPGRLMLRDEGAEPTAEAPHTEGMRYVPAEEHPASSPRLVLRDEGSPNGIFVKVRGSVRLEPGDQVAADRK